MADRIACPDFGPVEPHPDGYYTQSVRVRIRDAFDFRIVGDAAFSDTPPRWRVPIGETHTVPNRSGYLRDWPTLEAAKADIRRLVAEGIV